jgi:hypothetical protein
MKKFLPFFLCALFFVCTHCFVFAADGFTFSGLLDSTLSLGAASDDDGNASFVYGLEEYANIRMNTRIGEAARFYGAFNCVAGAGLSAAALSASPYGIVSSNENYAAAIELERLYVHITNEKTGVDAGLMRLAFGYGAVFSPSDFFNPKNPLYPNARPRGILGGQFTYYPNDNSDVSAFAAAPRDPSSTAGGGFRTGISGETNGSKMSVQGLYTYESPSGTASGGVQYTGGSLKVDTFVGFTADLLYAYNNDNDDKARGLSASAGIDYALDNTDWYFIAEYLFNGGDSVTSANNGNIYGYRNNHLLYAIARYSASDYTHLSLACIAALDDGSATPIASFDTTLFQGMTLTAAAQAPLDRAVFSGNADDRGKLGPVQSGSHFLFTLKAELKF